MESTYISQNEVYIPPQKKKTTQQRKIEYKYHKNSIEAELRIKLKIWLSFLLVFSCIFFFYKRFFFCFGVAREEWKIKKNWKIEAFFVKYFHHVCLKINKLWFILKVFRMKILWIEKLKNIHISVIEYKHESNLELNIKK